MKNNNNNILSMFSTGYRSTLSSLNQLPNANPSLSSSSFPNVIMSLMREIILFWWPRPQNCNWVEERGDNPLNFSLPRSTPINARDKCNVKMFFSDPVTVLLSLGWWSVFSKHLTVIKSLPFFPPSHFTFGFSLFFAELCWKSQYFVHTLWHGLLHWSLRGSPTTLLHDTVSKVILMRKLHRDFLRSNCYWSLCSFLFACWHCLDLEALLVCVRSPLTCSGHPSSFL